MSSLPERRYTPAEYLALDRAAERKSQYYAGEMFAMSGASRRHNLIVTNLVRELSGLLRSRPCEVYPSDMRVKVSRTGLYTYPDVTVVCGEPRFEDEQVDILLNPTLIIEVLSDSTEDYDRGRKFAHYRQIESLKEYLLVAQDEPHVERYRRQDEHQWLLWETSQPDASVELASIRCEVTLHEIYAKVNFGEPADEP